MKKGKYLSKLAQRLAQSSFNDGRLVESQVTKAIKLLKSFPKYYSIEVLGQYLKAVKRIERQYTMVVEIAIPILPPTVKKMKKIVEKRNLPEGKQVKITKVVVYVNPEILGGFKLRIGDEIYDESVLGKIIQVKEAVGDGSGQSN